MKDYYFIIIAVLQFSAVATPLVYWALNPELTQMQVFFKFLWLIIGLTCLSLLIIYFTKDEKQ